MHRQKRQQRAGSYVPNVAKRDFRANYDVDSYSEWQESDGYRQTTSSGAQNPFVERAMLSSHSSSRGSSKLRKLGLTNLSPAERQYIKYLIRENKLPECSDERELTNCDSTDHYLHPTSIDAQMRVLLEKGLPQFLTLLLEKLPLMITAAFFLLKGKGQDVLLGLGLASLMINCGLDLARGVNAALETAAFQAFGAGCNVEESQLYREEMR